MLSGKKEEEKLKGIMTVLKEYNKMKNNNIRIKNTCPRKTEISYPSKYDENVSGRQVLEEDSKRKNEK